MLKQNPPPILWSCGDGPELEDGILNATLLLAPDLPTLAFLWNGPSQSLTFKHTPELLDVDLTVGVGILSKWNPFHQS